MRYLIYIILIAALTGCQNKTETYISKTGAKICDISIHLGQKVSSTLLNKNEIESQGSLDSYYISCDDPGTMFIGTGYDNSQMLSIDELSFDLHQDSTIYQIEGIWLPEDQNQTSNDLQKVRYEIEQQLGDPSTIRPVKWDHKGYNLTIGSHHLKNGTLVQYVTASENLLDS